MRTLAAALLAVVVPLKAAGQPQGSILFITSVNYLGGAQVPFLVDPRYQAELERAGWQIGYCTLSDLTWDKLRRFNCAVVTQNPDVMRYGLQDAFANGRELYRRFLQAGGGILIIPDLHRHRIIGHLNQLLAEYGLQVLFAPVQESDPARAEPLRAYRAAKAGVADQVAPHEVTAGVTRVLYPIFGEMTVTFVADESWTVVLRASPSASAHDSGGRGYDSSPPLLACREVGPGRLAVFSTHSSPFTLNPYHFMWDSGRFLNDGDGARLLDNIYRWLAAPSVASGALGGFTAGQQAEVFDISPRLAENPVRQTTMGPLGPPHPVLIGAQSSLSGGADSVAQMCARARQCGWEGIIFTEDAEALTDQGWEELVRACAAATEESFLAVPGVRFLCPDTGNEGIVFHLRKPWPEIDWRDTAFTTFVRIGVNNAWNANLAVVNSSRCPMPVRNLGAVNSMPLYSFTGAQVDDATGLFEQTCAEGWRLSPLVYRRITSAAEIPPADQGPVTHIYASAWGSDFPAERELLTETAVSSGPVIQRFRVVMPGPWESPHDRELRVELRLTSPRPISEVSVFWGSSLLRRFYADATEFATTLRHVTCESADLWLRAEDEGGGKAWCRAVPSHLVSYHHFIGSDRMNGYWYPTVPCPPGPEAQKISGRWARILGSLYPGWGWGDRIEVRSASQQDLPPGLETGPPDGGVREIRLAPRIETTSGGPPLATAPVRRVVLNSYDCVILQDHIEEYVRGVTGEDGRHRRSIVRDPRLVRAESTLIGFRWRETMMLHCEVKLERGPAELADSIRPNPALLEVRAGDTTDAYSHVRVVYADGEQLRTDGPRLPLTQCARPGYVTLSPHPFGTPAVFFLRPGTAVAVTEMFGAPAIHLGPDAQHRGSPGVAPDEGEYVFVLTDGADQEAQLARIADRYGFDGTPAWSARITGGREESVPGILGVRCDEGADGATLQIAAVDLPNPLPVVVRQLRGDWDAAIVDLDLRRLERHCAVWSDSAWVALEADRPRRVFIGHPVVADDPAGLIIAVCSLSAQGGEVIVHNPNRRRIETRLRVNPALAELLTWQQGIALNPGETRTLKLEP